MSENNKISTEEKNVISNIALNNKREKKLIIMFSFIVSVMSQVLIIMLEKPKIFFQPPLTILLNIALILTTAAIFSGYIGHDIGTVIKIQRRKLKYFVLFSAFILLSLFLYKLIFLIYLLPQEYDLPIILVGFFSVVTGSIGFFIQGICFEILNSINQKIIDVIWYLIGSTLICFSLSLSLLMSIK